MTLGGTEMSERPSRRPWLAPWCSHLVLLSMLVGLLSVGCQEAQRLELYLAFDPRETADAAEPMPLELAGVEATEWVADRFATIAGIELELRRTAEPVLRIDPEDVERLIVREGIPSPGVVADGESWSAEIELRESAADASRRLAEVAAARQDLFLLTRVSGRNIDLAPLEVGRATTLPGGTFRTREEVERFHAAILAQAPGGLRIEPLPEAERAFWALRNRALVELAIWQLECDPVAAQRLGDALIEGLRAESDIGQRRAAADCSSAPPRMPEAPRTRD